ncbi:lactoylglutathione lyase [Eupransor demetentiae]|uniref:Vicinal oxygen chelate (VOC) family (GloA) n=1 Tax=Eupransor demetentiae TaxID=3109584 RepID=A0ABP0ESD2_9LACO|nr:3-dioxygenase or related enzyme [Lactobacillaceae bacterium LMG 33000]
MKARKLDHKTILALDPNRAYRFWRDAFDLPQTGAQTDRRLTLDGEEIHFVEGQPAGPFEILVRDHQTELRQHLANNFIPIEKEEERFNNKIAFYIRDSEGNQVILEANQ